MNKVAIPVIIIAIAIPLLVVGLMPAPDADEIGKEFARNHPGAVIGFHVLEEDISEQEEVSRARIIIEGTVQEAKPFWKIDSGDEYPYILTEYTVKVNNVIKGNVLANQTIAVLMRGGTLDGITAHAESVDIGLGDSVIMLLGQDASSIWSNSYFPISATKSTYVLDGEQAKNKIESRSMDETALKEKLARLSG